MEAICPLSKVHTLTAKQRPLYGELAKIQLVLWRADVRRIGARIGYLKKKLAATKQAA
jgi:hypothetical protein